MRAPARVALRWWKLLWLLTALAGAGAGHAAGVGPDAHGIVRYTVDKPFAEVIFELNFAITDHNFRITGRNSIGSGLRDRGYKDFPEVEVIHFCSLELAHEVLELDPGYVALMPCRLSVHEQGGKTVISLVTLPLDHPNPKVNDFARKVNAELREIVEFAVAP